MKKVPMFSYPKDFVFAKENVQRLIKAEQNCLGCFKWFEIPLKDVVFILEYENNNPTKSLIPMTDCVCTNCNKKQLVILPGKYDRLKAKNPELQRYRFKT